MLNNPYNASAMVSSSLPTLINTVSSTSSYTLTQSFGGAPQQTGYPQGNTFGSPYAQFNPYGQPMMAQPPIQMSAPPVAPPMPVMQPGIMLAPSQPVMSPVYIQPGRIISRYVQGIYRTYIPPIITRVPPSPYGIGAIRQPMPMPLVYTTRPY